MCISLIQEQVARQSAMMIGSKEEVIELDTVEIVPRQKGFLTNDETKTNVTPVPLVIPDGEIPQADRPETAGTLPGETIENSNEDDEASQNEEEEAEDDQEDGEEEEEEDEEGEEEDEDEEEDDGDEDAEEDEDEDDEWDLFSGAYLF